MVAFSGDDEPRAHTHSHDHPNDTKTVDPRRQHGHGHTEYKATDFDMDKLRSTLKQFVRDWSEDVRVSMIRRLFAVRHGFVIRGKQSVICATNR